MGNESEVPFRFTFKMFSQHSRKPNGLLRKEVPAMRRSPGCSTSCGHHRRPLRARPRRLRCSFAPLLRWTCFVLLSDSLNLPHQSSFISHHHQPTIIITKIRLLSATPAFSGCPEKRPTKSACGSRRFKTATTRTSFVWRTGIIFITTSRLGSIRPLRRISGTGPAPRPPADPDLASTLKRCSR